MPFEMPKDSCVRDLVPNAVFRGETEPGKHGRSFILEAYLIFVLDIHVGGGERERERERTLYIMLRTNAPIYTMGLGTSEPLQNSTYITSIPETYLLVTYTEVPLPLVTTKFR